MNRHLVRAACLALVAGASAAPSSVSQAHSRSFLDDLGTALEPPATTLATNCDTNPYGVALVPDGFPAGGGPLRPGDILVSNFNNSQNLQGTGTTIVRVTPTGQTSVFFQGQPGLGLTTALGVLKRGFVIVGSVPTTDGTSNTIQKGSLLIINNQGDQLLA